MKVEDYSVNKNTKICEIVEKFYFSGGFMSKNLALGAKILGEMLDDKKCLKMLSFPACIISTGLRGPIIQLVREREIDLIITTCGTLDHDIARTKSFYEHGDFMANDSELLKEGKHRLGNVFIKKENYGETIEQFMDKIAEGLNEKRLSTYELCWEIGKNLNESSLLYWCWKKKTPVIVPGISDGAVGTKILMLSQEKKFFVDPWLDEQFLLNKIFDSEKLGALMIGGGISKHHVIWWSQFKHGLDYAIYITTAQEYDGSLSGARIEEAISWGKVKAGAKFVNIYGDATIILPLVIGANL
jgi:deoxyhypusine synthase